MHTVVGSKHIDSPGRGDVKGNMFQKPAMENNYCAPFPFVAVVDWVLKYVPVGNGWIVLGIQCEKWTLRGESPAGVQTNYPIFLSIIGWPGELWDGLKTERERERPSINKTLSKPKWIADVSAGSADFFGNTTPNREQVHLSHYKELRWNRAVICTRQDCRNYARTRVKKCVCYAQDSICVLYFHLSVFKKFCGCFDHLQK